MLVIICITKYKTLKLVMDFIEKKIIKKKAYHLIYFQIVELITDGFECNLDRKNYDL